MKRKKGQTQAGADEERKMNDQLLERVKGLYGAMKVDKFVVMTVIDVGDWHVTKKVSW